MPKMEQKNKQILTDWKTTTQLMPSMSAAMKKIIGKIYRVNCNKFGGGKANLRTVIKTLRVETTGMKLTVQK